MAKSRSRSSPRRRSKRRVKASAPQPRWRRWLPWQVAGIVVLLAGAYLIYLDSVIRVEFEGKRWSVPAHVYARPLELFPGQHISREQFIRELEWLNYHHGVDGGRPGSYDRHGQRFSVISRPFSFWDGREPQTQFEILFDGDTVKELVELPHRQSLALVRLDPVHFASISPAHNEDRIIVRREELPRLLVKALIAVEDRSFDDHPGVDARGLARAVLANIKAGEMVQGGSTLTQQLVKNFFLTSERSLGRKLKEALMALLLELHYDKDDILTAYCNEIYLGQDGRRAIHGFGLGAQFYFGVPLTELEPQDLALLVGLVKGPSLFDPRKSPERALRRRNVVLDILAEQGVLPPTEVRSLKASPLAVTPGTPSASRFPAFVDLVRAQLRSDYKEEDLRSEGLRIFTTLDPQVQWAAEHAVERGLRELDAGDPARPQALQGAALVTDVSAGEVLGLVGDRRPRYNDFNRALLARRQVGSIIKPMVYLTALAHGGYTLASPIDDGPLAVEVEGDLPWAPSNFDNRSHGVVPLFTALANSYNLATVRLGMDVGLQGVRRMISRLGVEQDINPYPSLLLGAVDLTPLQVAQMYHTVANGGFFAPLRAIRAVVSADGQLLQRYGVDVTQVVAPEAAYLTTTALHYAVREGTGAALRNYMDSDRVIAGKTGTSNDARDSWFAGYGGSHLAVVWVGRDDNHPIGLTGASGAMRIWGDLSNRIEMSSLPMTPPENIEWRWLERDTQTLSLENCPNSVVLPFVRGTEPGVWSECGAAGQRNPVEKTIDWFKKWFE